MKSNRIPLKGTFELTARCNMQCNMCYVRVDADAIKKSGKRELTTNEWIHMAEQAYDAGTLTLLLTGGEVTMRPDFCEIYEAIAQMGFVTTVYTNATNVSDKLMDVFEKYPPHSIGVTMYGASPETYQKICGHADGYDRFIKGLRRLKTLPSLLQTRTTLVKKNISDYDAMDSFLRAELGYDSPLSISSNIYNSMRGGICDPTKERLSPMEQHELFFKYLDFFIQHLDEGKISAEEIRNSEKYQQMEKLIKRNTFGPDSGYLFEACGAGIDDYFISWSGEMYACGMLPKGCTDALKDGFVSAWCDLPQQYPLSKVPSKCRTCEKQNLCDVCPAFCAAETGDWFGIPEVACESAALLKAKVDTLFRKVNNG